MAVGLSTWAEVSSLKYPGDEARYIWYLGSGSLATNWFTGCWQLGWVRRLRYHGFGTMTTSNPGLQGEAAGLGGFGALA